MKLALSAEGKMRSKLLLLLLFLAVARAQTRTRNRDDDNGDDGGDQGDEGTVKSKPVIIHLPKNRLSPELHSISSLRKAEEEVATEPPKVIERPSVTLPPVASLSPNIGGISLIPPVPTPIPVSLRPGVPQRQAVLQLPQQALSNNPLISNALANGNGLAGILSNNPSLLKLLQGISGPPGTAGAGGPPGVSALSPGFGQGGLLAPLQGALPSLGQPPPFPSLGGGPPGSAGIPDKGLLNVISSLGRQLGGAGKWSEYSI